MTVDIHLWFIRQKNPKSKYKSWIIANIERGGISFKYTTVNSLDYSDIEKDCHLYYLPIEKYNSDLYYLIPDLIKVFENIKYDKAITIKIFIKNYMDEKRLWLWIIDFLLI